MSHTDGRFTRRLDYEALRTLHAAGFTQVRIAAVLGCTQQLVSAVITGKQGSQDFRVSG